MKAQAFLTDLLVAMLLFVILFSIFMVSFAHTMTTSQENMELMEAEARMNTFMSLLLRTPGLPEDWENQSGNPTTIGLAHGQENVLDTNKVIRFLALDHHTTRQIMDTGAYDYQLRFVDNNLTAGPAPPPLASTVLFARRYVLYNMTFEEIELRMWRP